MAWGQNGTQDATKQTHLLHERRTLERSEKAVAGANDNKKNVGQRTPVVRRPRRERECNHRRLLQRQLALQTDAITTDNNISTNQPTLCDSNAGTH